MTWPGPSAGAAAAVVGSAPPGATEYVRLSVMLPLVMPVAPDATVTAARMIAALGVAGWPSPGVPAAISTSQ